MKNTIVVNLFAGPGAGKSTGAAYVFSQLKMKGIDCEYVTEFAKDKVWEDNKEVFKNQFYITGKQSFKISRCYGKVDVIITDSPILLSAIYGQTESGYFENAVCEEFNKYNNLNFFIERDNDYQQNGRNQTAEEAFEIDRRLYRFLDANLVEFIPVKGNIDGYRIIVDTILLNI